VDTARRFLRDARRKTPTLMIFIDDLENIVEPNHKRAQLNLHSTSQWEARFSRFSRNRPKTIRQTNECTFYLVVFSFRNFVILLLFGEAEAGSAEEQPAKE
jgi:hypothetical protein